MIQITYLFNTILFELTRYRYGNIFENSQRYYLYIKIIFVLLNENYKVCKYPFNM